MLEFPPKIQLQWAAVMREIEQQAEWLQEGKEARVEVLQASPVPNPRLSQPRYLN